MAKMTDFEYLEASHFIFFLFPFFSLKGTQYAY